MPNPLSSPLTPSPHLISLRKINSPYRGTLSSYGYTLLVLFFLIHIQSPPVLPNLQRIPPTRPVAKEDMELDGHDIWFFDDTEALRKGWQSSNLQSVGELYVLLYWPS